MPSLSIAKLIALGLVVLAIFSAIGTGVYKIKQWGYNEAKAECIAAADKQRKIEADKNKQAEINRETDKTNATIVYKTIHDRVVTYIDRPVYNSACIDDDGLRDINAALLGTKPDQSGVTRGMPKVDPTKGSNR